MAKRCQQSNSDELSAGGTLHYLTGDATVPQVAGQKVIRHICNTLGKWGKGFVLVVSKRWPTVREEYLRWHKEKTTFGLGAVQFVKVAPYITVANMIGQQGIKSGSKGPPIRYEAVRQGLTTVADHIEQVRTGASVHMPRIGCGLAGGKWDQIEPIIQKTLLVRGISVYVYDF